MALQLIPKRRVLPNTSLVHLFSTAADSDDRLKSYLDDVKSSLQHDRSPPIHRLTRSPPPSHSGSDPTYDITLGRIRKALHGFRPPAADSSPPPDDSNPPPKSRTMFSQRAPGDGGSGAISWGPIRDDLSKISKKSSGLADIQKMLNSPSTVTRNGIPADLPAKVFGREMKEREEGRHGESEKMSAEKKALFVRMYGYEELGVKLRELRPKEKTKEEGWFSIEELSARLEKLREREYEEHTLSSGIGKSFVHIRESLVSLHEGNKKSSSHQQFLSNIWGQDTSIDYLKLPPKEHLLETYNHPDNMSAAEKMKIELVKVREEFKMSESDCGSTRVQVALLTTKIKYLSSVLHKKDKHSRKGLVEMVHKRKRLLKYLRRTDWDSYCLVLDKLGLRDTPEYKTYDYKH